MLLDTKIDDLSTVAATKRAGVSIRNLRKYYGRQAAIDDISISIEEGSLVTFLGPSGSGKTTVLMSIAGFVRSDHGQIIIGGKDVSALPPEKRNLGMMFQGYALFPNMTVEENVWFPLRVRGVSRAKARERVKATLELVQMAHLSNRTSTELSGGQQQRVALARSIVFEPSLLLLDEPLSALDRALRTELQWELKSLHRRLGSTFINVTHDQEEALSLSDRIVILKDGRIEQFGTPAELYNKPCNYFVASFLGESNFIRGKVSGKQSGRFHYSVGSASFLQAGAPLSAEDEEVLISLRPENMIVSAERPDASNAVQGKILEFKYVGSSYFLQVETEKLGQMMVRTAAWQAAIDPESSDPIWIGWEPDAATVVQAE